MPDADASRKRDIQRYIKSAVGAGKVLRARGGTVSKMRHLRGSPAAARPSGLGCIEIPGVGRADQANARWRLGFAMPSRNHPRIARGRSFRFSILAPAESHRRPEFRLALRNKAFPHLLAGDRMADSIAGIWVIQLSAAARTRAFAQSILAQDSLRRPSISVENRSRRPSSQCNRGQMELFKKDMTQQLLTAKFSRRLRAICATPVQKGVGSTRLRRFLCTKEPPQTGGANPF